MFDRELLDSMVAEGWLRSQRHPEADLWIFNYTERTQFENHWTPETLACRGLILDADGEVIARPFPKFFNYGTPQVGELPVEPFTVTEKIDGSLGIAYWLPGEPDPCIATRGSFTSEQAIEGTRMIQGRELEWGPDVTPLFEIVYPENRIVVDYGDRRDLIFLAALDNRSGREVDFPEWIWERAEVHNEPSLTFLIDRNRSNAEGYVITFESGLRIKIKHAEYVRLHKLITGVNARHIWEILKEGGGLNSMLDGIPDELYGWICATRDTLEVQFAMEAQAASDVFTARPAHADRKALAAYFRANAANAAVLFRMLDSKPYEDLIWKAIKPEPTTPDTIWTRDAGVAA